MVLAPSLVDKNLNRTWVMELCQKLAKKINVVVLSPSEAVAHDWESVGAKVVLGDEVSAVIMDLKNASSNVRFVVFVQRYDGIDLPDSACRILVIDGIPHGEGISDRYDSSIKETAGGIRNRLIYRIEQGMGRAVRSHADYAVIILSGPEIAHFIARRDVLEVMNPDTKAQLQLALDLAKLATEEGEGNPEKALTDMLLKSLKRDDGWKQFYDENVRKLTKDKSRKHDDTFMRMADAERRAFQMAVANNPDEARRILQKSVDEYHLNEIDRGWYLQKIAKYTHETNAADALEIQRSAYEHNNAVLCPPVITKRPSLPEKFDVQARIVDWFKKFANPNGSIAAIQDLMARLSYEVSPPTIENAIKELARVVGAVGSRPEKEYGEGPDNLWLWPSLSLVIEVKNENKEALHKKDAGQLLLSLQWFERTFPKRDPALPVVVGKVSLADPKAGFPEGTRVLTPEKMKYLLEKIESFFQKLVDDPSLLLSPQEIYELQTKVGISPEQFKGNYTVPLKERR